jgi:DNA-binding CsgD family transcriptional regulator/tetratricopeptide (TPR) repeat protein
MSVGSSASPLFGREAEQRELNDALARTRTGTGGCVVLTGPPGIGKSRLVRFAIERAEELGLAVAAGGATELDRVSPLATLVSSLQAAQPDPIDLTRVKGHEESSYWFIDRLGEALESYTAKRPLLVIVDDVQWADELSALALRVLVPMLASSPLRWLLARRSAPSDSATHEVLDGLIREGAPEIRLGPLGAPAVEQLCSHVLGATADDTVLALASRAFGNPFLLEQLLLAMSSAQQILTAEGTATVTGGELPASFVAAVDQRLRGLSVPARTLLNCGSIFGRPFTVHAAAQLSGLRVTELLAGADEAIGAEILHGADARLSFTHDLLRQAVYDHLAGPVRAALHREAATVVAAEGCSAVEVAEHYVRSGTTGDRKAVRVLRVAAAEVVARAPGTAADLLVRAMHMLGEHDRDRAILSAEAVGPLALSGRLTQAREVGEAALLGHLDPATEATTLLGLAEALKHAGQNAAAASYADRALHRPGVPDRTRAALHAIAAHALLWEDDPTAADHAGAQADRIGTAAGEHGAAVFGITARSVVARTQGRLGDALTHAERAVRIADEVGGEAVHRHPRIWLGAALCAVDRLDDAMAALRTGRQEAERLGTAWSIPLWHFYHSSALLAVGDLDSATAEAEAGQAIAASLTASQMSMPLLGLLARIAVLRDQRPVARDYLRQMQALLDSGVSAAQEDLAFAQSAFREIEKKPEAARDALIGVYDQLPDRLLLFSTEPGSAATMVRIARAAADPDRARATVAAAQTLADRNPDIPGLAGAAAHARGLLTGRLSDLRAAVDSYRSSKRRLDRAVALEDCAQAESVAGDRARAIELLELAVNEYRACGAHLHRKRSERTLGMLGVRKRGTGAGPGTSRIGGLTDSEFNVASRVVQGLTNREVGEQLFISHHTVDSHLRKAFQKLGINSRIELTRILMEYDGV